MSEELRVPILISERAGIERRAEPLRLGVPLPKGQLRDASRVRIVDDADCLLPSQARALATWPDRSIKWLLVDVLVTAAAHERLRLRLYEAHVEDAVSAAGSPTLRVEARSGTYLVDTGAVTFEVGGQGGMLFGAARDGRQLLGEGGARLHLTGCRGRQYVATAERVRIEESGAIRCSLLAEGHFQAAGHRLPLDFRARFIFTAGACAVRSELQVHNPQAASHPGGVWDLDDRGTVMFEDLSLLLAPASPVRELRWYAEGSEGLRTEAPDDWLLYQDSSGGENWDSPTHVDGKGRSTVTFRGYRVTCSDTPGQMLMSEGDRAVPCLCVVSDHGTIAATTLGFWENFPKALRWRDGRLSAGLFPAECRAPFALQGGEQKRHTVLLEFLRPGEALSIPGQQRPLATQLDPAWVESSGTLGHFVAASRDPNEGYLRYIGAILDGPHAFAAKRELIDEYGWRNFGDLYADHEAVGHRGPRPLVSHFNNQYDFIHAALVHYLRSADSRWRELADAAAQHTIDIDIYHTDRDKAAFNHGLFWHTDHYKPAATCTHRTYSRHNGRGRGYGGGPGNEHNYTTGLLLYHYLSGDPEAADAVRELADWVLAMDDGTCTVLGLIDAGPTGLASQTVEPSYHKAGRGAGNSINALLDAYELSHERRYLGKAEELIGRCIHPADDIEALRLSEPELRWSYLVFLQVLGKYLHCKIEWGERDYAFHHARASLLHYARWMALNEVPYKQVLDRVQLPTETWPAQDMRKCHALHLAAQFCPPAERARLHERAAFFFDRSLEDVLSFDTAFLTRPLVILSAYGYPHAFFQLHADAAVEVEDFPYSFGRPEAFTPQRQRWRAVLPARMRLLVSQLTRAGADWLGVIGRRSTPWRL